MLFSTFYNKLNKLINKDAPPRSLSKRRIKRLSKPWITKGIRTSIGIVIEISINFTEIKFCTFLELVKEHLSQLFHAKRMQYEKDLGMYKCVD